jgi:pimeloyl-ACP methyl ester carboxylesterase
MTASVQHDIPPPDIYAYDPKEVQFTCTRVDRYTGCDVFEVTFRSPVTTGFPENDVARAFHFRPVVHRWRLGILVVHGWFAHHHGPEMAMARLLARRGYDAVVPTLPYHMERTPPETMSGQYFFSTERDRSFHAYRQAIIDLCCLGDYLKRYGLTLGVMGMSLGAILLHTLMGVDSRYEVGISILGSGNINDIVWKGIMGRFMVRFLKAQGVTKKHYREMMADFRQFLTEVWTTGEIPHPTYEWYLLDPLTYAHRNRPRHVLLVNGLLDLVVPLSTVREFHRALGRPPLILLPCSHFTIGPFMPIVILVTLAYLRKYARTCKPASS